MVTVKLLVSQCQGHVAAATQMLCEGRHQELLFIGLCAIIVSVTSNINFVCLESRQPVVFVFSDCHRDRNAGMLHIKHYFVIVSTESSQQIMSLHVAEGRVNEPG